MAEQGQLSIHTENIFPIIKKFLYSDQEIFLRELVANAIDATQKLKRLAAMGDYAGSVAEAKVRIAINENLKTITVSDSGIGMTDEEIKKYINQIAFSGASEFLEKYKDSEESKQIIGHFGLGFYSAFMVAKKVEIITRSYTTTDKEQAFRWSCTGDTSYEITPAVRKEVGTDVVLHIAEDAEEFLQKYRISEILRKYGRFLPIEIEFDGQVINDPHPIWTKNPTDLKDEDYTNFYKELYPASTEPLFWIHLNVDYPFNLTGVLYFPKIRPDLALQRNQIQLYSRQVFITDEVRDIVPEFLTLLHGVIDSPDIPLNVSRSYLQSDSNVKKINNYITRKVADKLHELFKNDREGYQQKWDNIGMFVKYGMVTEDKFYEKAQKFSLYKNTDGEYFTLEEYLERIAPEQTDKNENRVILYTNDPQRQHGYIQSAKKRNYDIVIFDAPMIDNHFIQQLETKGEKIRVQRVDANTADKLIEKEITLEVVLSEEEQEKIKQLFEQTINNTNYTVAVEPQPADELPVSITVPEFMRRMREMGVQQGMDLGMLPEQFNVSINGNHSLLQTLLTQPEESQKDTAKQLFDLALLSQNLLQGEHLTAFLERSVAMLQKN
ncbi:MAG: molecular chaperone HtpG [Bernardetiaceae bacterium]